MPKIFISYRRKNWPFTQPLVKDLRARLEAEVYIDLTSIDNVEFEKSILPNLRSSDVVLLIVTEQTFDATRIFRADDWVRREIREAMTHNVPIILVSVDGLLPPNDLPDDIRPLGKYQAVKFYPEYYDSGVERLAKFIATAIPAIKLKPLTDSIPTQTQPMETPPSIPAPSPRPAWMSRVLVGMVLALIVVVVIGAVLNNGQGANGQTPQATTAVAQVESPTVTDSPTDSASPTPTETPTVTLSPTITETPDYVAAAQTVAAQGTRDYENARAAETVEAATLYPAQTATQTALYAQQTETQAAILTATATQWTKTPTPNATLTITALIADWATQTQAAHFTATATLWTNTPTPTPTFTPTFTPTPTPTPNATQTLEAFARTPMPENAVWTPVEQVIDDVTMVFVPAGCFMMGSNQYDDEKPIHEVCITEPFWLDKTEVWQAQFLAKGGVKANANGFTGDDRPVERITWREAEAYCREKRGGRLPTEAEWEFAARGPDGLVYPWGDEFVVEYVVYSGNSEIQTGNVGDDIRVSGASWVGALDLSGNVWEWTSSLYLNYPYNPDDGREDLTESGSRVLRGGSWNSNDNNLRAAYRGSNAADSNHIGFRCALS